MSYRRATVGIAWGLGSLGMLFAFQRPWHEVPGVEYNEFPLPADYQDKTEWQFARLIYPPSSRFRQWRRRFSGGDYRMGRSNWTIDYPRSDRHFSAALARLTRVHARSVEQVIDLLDPEFPNDVYNYPWLYAVEVGHWELTDEQAKKLRDYLDRGGFLMVDDFHGTEEWQVFVESMSRVFPDRPIVELDSTEPIFHTIFDLDARYQVPGAQFLRSGRTFEFDGFEARWRGIQDKTGRVVVGICHNMDLGDSWEHADNPEYPEKYSALGFRIGVNYVLYAMTH